MSKYKISAAHHAGAKAAIADVNSGKSVVDGTYKCRVKTVEVKDNDNFACSQVVLRMEITEGVFTGRGLTKNQNLSYNAKGHAAALWRAFGVPEIGEGALLDALNDGAKVATDMLVGREATFTRTTTSQLDRDGNAIVKIDVVEQTEA